MEPVVNNLQPIASRLDPFEWRSSPGIQTNQPLRKMDHSPKTAAAMSPRR